MRNLIHRLTLALALVAGIAIAASAATTPAAQMQFPTLGWGAYAPSAIQCGELLGANFNVTTDQPIPITVPSSTFMLDRIEIGNASVSLTTAAGGFYQSASKGGTILVAAAQAYTTLTAAAVDAAGSAMSATLAVGATTSILDLSTIYFSLTTGQGVAAIADIRAYCRPRY